MEYSALVVAAGSGSRMGLGYNKLLFTFEDGQTVIEKTLEIFQNDDRCIQIVVVISEADEAKMRPLLSDKATYVFGGAQRFDSVYHGLKVVKSDTVLIHDGARPWLSKACLNALLKKKEQCRACLLMVPVKDTIKEVVDGVVVKTHERSALMQAQTPQAFDLDLLLTSYQKCMEEHGTVTDDAQVVERYSDETIYAVPGSYDNKKITTIEDIEYVK